VDALAGVVVVLRVEGLAAVNADSNVRGDRLLVQRALDRDGGIDRRRW
jgi:hypothetical protein